MKVTFNEVFSFKTLIKVVILLAFPWIYVSYFDFQLGISNLFVIIVFGGIVLVAFNWIKTIFLPPKYGIQLGSGAWHYAEYLSYHGYFINGTKNYREMMYSLYEPIWYRLRLCWWYLSHEKIYQKLIGLFVLILVLILVVITIPLSVVITLLFPVIYIFVYRRKAVILTRDGSLIVTTPAFNFFTGVSTSYAQGKIIEISAGEGNIKDDIFGRRVYFNPGTYLRFKEDADVITTIGPLKVDPKTRQSTFITELNKVSNFFSVNPGGAPPPVTGFVPPK